jgi:hypothetical protein
MMAFDVSFGMWQSTQFSAILCPLCWKIPQLSTLWHARQLRVKAAAFRCGRWTLWHVEQVMVED